MYVALHTFFFQQKKCIYIFFFNKKNVYTFFLFEKNVYTFFWCFFDLIFNKKNVNIYTFFFQQKKCINIHFFFQHEQKKTYISLRIHFLKKMYVKKCIYIFFTTLAKKNVCCHVIFVTYIFLFQKKCIYIFFFMRQRGVKEFLRKKHKKSGQDIRRNGQRF